jgi:hypothetical protein
LKNKLLRQIIPISKLKKPVQITAPKGMTVFLWNYKGKYSKVPDPCKNPPIADHTFS